MKMHVKTVDDTTTFEVAREVLMNTQAEETSVLSEVGDLQKEANEIMSRYIKK